MKKLNLRTSAPPASFEIPVAFVDTYMNDASALSLKVYLYLKRASLDPTLLLSVEEIAERFDVTSNQIVLSLRFWAEKGLLSLGFTGGELSDVLLLPMEKNAPAQPVQAAAPSHHTKKAAPVQLLTLDETPAEAPAQMMQTPVQTPVQAPIQVPGQAPVQAPLQTQAPVQAASAEAPAPAKAQAPVVDLNEVFRDPEFSGILQLAEFYLRKPVTSSMRNALADVYLILDRKADLVEYLLELCIDRNITTPQYMKSIANGWQEEGLTSVEQIREKNAARSKQVYGVMNEFGLRTREPSPEERDYILSWTSDFELEIVLEACRRTMHALHTPDFKYANGILSRWKAAKVRTLDDIKTLDAAHERRKEAAAAPRETAPKKTAFHNFPERKTNYNELFESLAKKKKKGVV